MFTYRGALISASLMALLLSAAGCGRDADALKQEHLSNGDRYLAERNFNAAAVEYRNALAQDARFGRARYQLGRAYAALGNWEGARAELVRAADLLPQDVDAQVSAANVLLRFGEFQDAKTRAELALAINPKSPEAHIARGSAAAGLRDLEGALRSFEEGLVAQPDRTELYVNMGLVRAAKGDPAEAEASFKQAIAVSPSSIPARLAYANYLWSAGRVEDAETVVREAIATDPAAPDANRALAILLLATERGAEAEAPLRRVAESTDDPGPQLMLADYYVSQNRSSDALPILTALAGRPEAFAAAMSRRAGIEYELGRAGEAHRILDEILVKDAANASVFVVKGTWLLAEGKADEALAAATSGVKADPQLWSAHELLGLVQSARRQPQAASAAFTEALRLNPRALRAQIALAEASLAEANVDAAVRFADEALASQPTSGLARLVLVRSLLAKNDVARARTELQPLAEAAPDEARVQALIGEVALRGGDHVGARRAFERAAALDPKSPEVVGGLVRLEYAAKRPDQAVRHVESLMRRSPADPMALYLAAQTYAGAGQFAEAEAAARKAIAADPAYFEAYGLLGRMLVRQRRLDDARVEFERIVAQRPNDVGAHTLIGMVYQTQRRQDEAKQAYERILAIDSRAVVAANNLAYMYAEAGTNLDVALSLAQTAKAGRPDDPEVNDTLGWVFYKRGLPSLAIEPLQQSVSKDPSNPLYQFHLGMAYLKTGDDSKARAALEQALKLQPNFEGAGEAKKALAELKG